MREHYINNVRKPLTVGNLDTAFFQAWCAEENKNYNLFVHLIKMNDEVFEAAFPVTKKQFIKNLIKYFDRKYEVTLVIKDNSVIFAR